jgi:hypothetical protein
MKYPDVIERRALLVAERADLSKKLTRTCLDIAHENVRRFVDLPRFPPAGNVRMSQHSPLPRVASAVVNAARVALISRFRWHMPCIVSAMIRTSKTLMVLGVVLLIVIAARAASPWFVKSWVNRELSDMGEYRGTVADVDLSMLRGGYTAYDLTIVKVDAADVATPFIAIERMDLALQWGALLKGDAVGAMVMHRPIVNLVRSETATGSQLGTGVNWPQEVRELFPFQLNVVEAVNGLVTFRAPGIEPHESLTASDFQMTLWNLNNAQRREVEAFADVDLSARVVDSAPLRLTGQIDPNEELPAFDIDVTLEGARLVDMNPWLREFINVDAHEGVFSLYAELAAADGRFEGYLRPILENPKFFQPGEPASGPFMRLWEGLVGLAAKILENRAQDQVATQIPLAGEFEDPEAELLPALMNLLRNAFIASFAHSLQGTIDLGDVTGDPACFGPETQRDTAEPRLERDQPRQDRPERRRGRDTRRREERQGETDCD